MIKIVVVVNLRIEFVVFFSLFSSRRFLLSGNAHENGILIGQPESNTSDCCSATCLSSDVWRDLGSVPRILYTERLIRVRLMSRCLSARIISICLRMDCSKAPKPADLLAALPPARPDANRVFSFHKCNARWLKSRNLSCLFWISVSYSATFIFFVGGLWSSLFSASSSTSSSVSLGISSSLE